MDFGRVPAIRSNFSIDGAYYHITKIDNVIPFSQRKNISYQGERFPYLPVYAGNDGSVKQRLNSNIHVNTHIPKLRMVTSLTGMLIWMDKSIESWKDENGQELAYALGDNNEKQHGNFTGDGFVYVDPIGFRDLDGNYHSWEDNYSFEAPYNFMIKQYMSYNYKEVSNPFTWQINLKLTKEIGNWAKLSFFANNLFNHRPLQLDLRSGYYERRNQSAYFGAELKLTL